MKAKLQNMERRDFFRIILMFPLFSSQEIINDANSYISFLSCVHNQCSERNAIPRERRKRADFHLRIIYSRHKTCQIIFIIRNSDQKLFTPKERTLQIFSLTVKQRKCINISDELLAGKIGRAFCLLTNFTFVCNIILCKQFIVRQIRCCQGSPVLKRGLCIMPKQILTPAPLYITCKQ